MKLSVKISKPKIEKIGSFLAEAGSELVGSFMLMFMIFISPIMINSVEPFIIATSVIALMLVFGIFSKPHLNPLFTFAEYFVSLIVQIREKKFDLDKLWEFLSYLVAQLIGGFLAFGVANSMMGYIVDAQILLNPDSFTGIANAKDQLIEQISFTTKFTGDIGSTVFSIEMIFAFIMSFVYLVPALQTKNKTTIATAVGLMAFGVTVFASSYTGASFNPFRTMIPAFFEGGDALKQVPLYFGASVTGALIAALVYSIIDSLKALKLKQTSKK